MKAQSRVNALAPFPSVRARFALLALFLLAALSAAYALTFPQLTGRVVDEAGILDQAAKASLEQKLAAFETKTTGQLVTTFVQRRFADLAEMEATVRAVEGRNIDTRGHEAEGLYHAELYVSRPPAEVERCPLHDLVTVVSGANKPWTVGTNVLATNGDAARRRARSARPRLTVAQAP